MLAWLWVACEEPLPPEAVGPCDGEALAVEVAPPFGDYADFADGAELWCGNPPQGGAPYSPFRMRILGPGLMEDGVELEMTAEDPADGTLLAWTALTMGVTCANVGDNEGYWVGSEAHMRYSGFGLQELDGRPALVTITARSITDPSAQATASAVLLLYVTASEGS